MTFSNTLALFGAMLVLAAIPSVSVLTVMTRAATAGFIHGVFTTLGIVVGDLLFIGLALWGLAFLVTKMGSLFVFIQCLGGAYLIVLGVMLWRTKPKPLAIQATQEFSLWSSFMTGLLITLGDQKATLFYLGFFPAFLDLSKISYWDISLILIITILTVGGVKMGYALMADRAKGLMSTNSHPMNAITALVLVGVGLVVLTKAILQF